MQKTESLMAITEDEVREYDENGYLVLKKFWPEVLINSWEQTIIAIYHQQALKLKQVRKHLEKGLNPTDYDTVENLDHILTILEKEDKEAAYQSIFMCERSCAGGRLSTFSKLLDLCGTLLRVPEELLLFHGPQPLINLPSTKRLLYHWHQESCYYPKRRSFLNFWFPIFRDKNPQNGTMWFCKGSHDISIRQFIEYQGWDRETYNHKNHFIQYEVPEEELDSYEKIPVTLQRGDAGVFHPSLVHASTLNESNIPSYATTLRVWECRRDLTLSGHMAAMPYSAGDYGNPDLRPLLIN